MESMWISEKPIEQNNTQEWWEWKPFDSENYSKTLIWHHKKVDESRKLGWKGAEQLKILLFKNERNTEKEWIEKLNENNEKDKDMGDVENVEDSKNVGDDANTENNNEVESAKENGNVANTENNNEKNNEKEREVENFIRKNCSEPIENVNTIKPFKELVSLIVKSAKEEFDKAQKSLSDHILSAKALKKYINAKQVRNKVRLFTLPDEEKNKLTDTEKKQIKWLAKDPRIYELPAYKELIEKWWFIIPSDIRTSYDSAGQRPVRHLWIDYNVKAWTPVKSIYDWEVVESTYTWEPWKSSLWYKVVVKHKAADWTEFYSLYGHLGSENLPKVWDKVTKWMEIWKVWAPFTDENWNREEHLHFQIMKEQNSPEWYSKDTQKEQIWNYDVLSAFGKAQQKNLDY